MKAFAQLLDRLSFEPSRNGKLRLMAEYFRAVPDPERGYALAALTDQLSFTNATPAMIRTVAAERTDPTLFGMSYHYVGDLSETVALMWPRPAEDAEAPPPLPLSAVVRTLATTGKLALPKQLAAWLDALDEVGRWALLKLITGSLRVGVSARLAKTAVASLGGLEPDEVEGVWHGMAPPYEALFAWVEGRGPKPATTEPAPFRTPMLAHAIEDRDLETLDPAAFSAEWKWDGIRVQAVTGVDGAGSRVVRLYSRTGEDVSGAFPDLVEALAAAPCAGASLDGELLVVRDGRVESFGTLQQRLNRKSVTPRLTEEYPIHLRVYDLLVEEGEDLRALPFTARRARLEAFVTRVALARRPRRSRA